MHVSIYLHVFLGKVNFSRKEEVVVNVDNLCREKRYQFYVPLIPIRREKGGEKHPPNFRVNDPLYRTSPFIARPVFAANTTDIHIRVLLD